MMDIRSGRQRHFADRARTGAVGPKGTGRYPPVNFQIAVTGYCEISAASRDDAVIPLNARAKSVGFRGPRLASTPPRLIYRSLLSTGSLRSLSHQQVRMDVGRAVIHRIAHYGDVALTVDCASV